MTAPLGYEVVGVTSRTGKGDIVLTAFRSGAFRPKEIDKIVKDAAARLGDTPVLLEPRDISADVTMRIVEWFAREPKTDIVVLQCRFPRRGKANDPTLTSRAGAREVRQRGNSQP